MKVDSDFENRNSDLLSSGVLFYGSKSVRVSDDKRMYRELL